MSCEVRVEPGITGDVLLRHGKVAGGVALFIKAVLFVKFYLYIIDRPDEIRVIYIEITPFRSTLSV